MRRNLTDCIVVRILIDCVPQDPVLTGLESSVVNNEGYGIEPFRASVRCCLLITQSASSPRQLMLLKTP